MQYIIESRDLTHHDVGPRQTTIDARDADEAISRFVHDSDSELMSVTKSAGRESIATVKKNEALYLLRVYAN